MFYNDLQGIVSSYSVAAVLLYYFCKSLPLNNGYIFSTGKLFILLFNRFLELNTALIVGISKFLEYLSFFFTYFCYFSPFYYCG
jgi:hypothetical protein